MVVVSFPKYHFHITSITHVVHAWSIYRHDWVNLFGQMLVNMPAPWSIWDMVEYCGSSVASMENLVKTSVVLSKLSYFTHLNYGQFGMISLAQYDYSEGEK